MSFSTAWSANAVSICQSCGLAKVNRVEIRCVLVAASDTRARTLPCAPRC